MRVLVTGSTGLLGRRIVAALGERGAEVSATSRSGDSGSTAADLTVQEATDRVVAATRPQLVVHLAGGRAAGIHLYAANVLSTVRLLDAVARRAPAARVVVFGSAAEYGDGEGVPLTETAPCEPVNEYGRAKLAQTALAAALAEKHGIEMLVLRPFNVVDSELPRSTALGNILAQLQTGTMPVRKVVCGRTDVVRDFVVADEVAAVVASLIDVWPPVQVLNLCSGTGLPLIDIINGISVALGVRAEVEVDPQLAAMPAADRVVGDAALLSAVGLRLDGSVHAVVSALLSDAARSTEISRERGPQDV